MYTYIILIIITDCYTYITAIPKAIRLDCILIFFIHLYLTENKYKNAFDVKDCFQSSYISQAFVIKLGKCHKNVKTLYLLCVKAHICNALHEKCIISNMILLFAFDHYYTVMEMFIMSLHT